MNNGFEIDSKSLEEIIKEMSPVALGKVQRKSLSAAAKTIYNVAKHLFVTRMPASKNKGGKYYYNHKPVYFTDSLSDAVRMYVKQGPDNDYFFKVHTMGVRRKSSGTFIARFFANGTKIRKNRGKLTAVNYFTDAIKQTEQKALEIMEKTFYNILPK